jgi:hypothetical protein
VVPRKQKEQQQDPWNMHDIELALNNTERQKSELHLDALIGPNNSPLLTSGRNSLYFIWKTLVTISGRSDAH